MKNSSQKIAMELLEEMNNYYALGLRFSVDLKTQSFEQLMKDWKQLETLALRCESMMEKLERTQVNDENLSQKLLEQAKKNSELMAAMARSLELEKIKVMDELSKLMSVPKGEGPTDSSFGYTL